MFNTINLRYHSFNEMLTARYQQQANVMEQLFISQKVLNLLAELGWPGETAEETLERIWQSQSE